MKERYAIPHKGLKEGRHTFEWRVGDDFWAARPEGGVTGGDVQVAATLEKGATGVMRLQVEITGGVVVPCDRCLEECTLPVSFRGRPTVTVAVDDGEHPSDGDVIWLAPGDSEIELEEYIYESVVLSLPLQRVHPEDVHGRPLCNPAMLERFKIVTEDEFNNLTT